MCKLGQIMTVLIQYPYELIRPEPLDYSCFRNICNKIQILCSVVQAVCQIWDLKEKKAEERRQDGHRTELKSNFKSKNCGTIAVHESLTRIHTRPAFSVCLVNTTSAEPTTETGVLCFLSSPQSSAIENLSASCCSLVPPITNRMVS